MPLLTTAALCATTPLDEIPLVLAGDQVRPLFDLSDKTPRELDAKLFTRTTVEEIEDLPGFDCYVFDNVERYRGFVTAAHLLFEADDNYSFSGGKIVDGLFVLVLQHRTGTAQTWHDHRASARTEKEACG